MQYQIGGIQRVIADEHCAFPAVDAVVEVPYGAFPGACRRHYYFSGDDIRSFLGLIAPMCKGGSPDALKAWFDENIFGVASFEEYLAKLPIQRFLDARAGEACAIERLA